MSLVRYELRPPAAILTLCRADKRNALSRALITLALAEIEAEAQDKQTTAEKPANDVQVERGRG